MYIYIYTYIAGPADRRVARRDVALRREPAVASLVQGLVEQLVALVLQQREVHPGVQPNERRAVLAQTRLGAHAELAEEVRGQKVHEAARGRRREPAYINMYIYIYIYTYIYI